NVAPLRDGERPGVREGPSLDQCFHQRYHLGRPNARLAFLCAYLCVPASPRGIESFPASLPRNRIIRIPVEDFIRIQGARVHNLKNISLSIPHEKLTVITGVSGSGKSSLAFDTIYAEGQRRYVESLSAYARQF